MRKHIQEYYQGTKQSALSLFVAAIVMIILGYMVFLSINDIIVYGLFGGVLAFSLLQIVMSSIWYIRATFRARKMLAECEHLKVLAEEHQSIQRAVPRFPKIRMVQEIFFGLSFVGIFLGMARIIPSVSMGIAMAVLLQMAIWIANDLFAQRRTEEYERRLRRHIENENPR